MKKRIVSLLLILVLAFTLVPSAFAADHNCGISNCVCLPGNPCSAVWEWQAYGSDLHWYVARCSGCGQIEFNWSSQAPHSFDSDGVCTVCGYVYVEPCYHYSTYTEWNGCNWYEYCDDCGALVDSGTSHSYSYGSWTYYNSSQHSRTATCTRCGSTTTSYGSHSTTTRYNTYTSTQHKVQKYCSTCGSYIGSATYESHSFAYGDWQDYSSEEIGEGGKMQFVTVETKSGNVFYLVIDHSTGDVYFLNLVDESDLLALLEDEGYEAECDCEVKCEAGEVNTDCPVCRTDLKGCKGEEPEPTPTPTPAADSEPEDDGGFNAAAILPIVLILLLIAGAAAVFLKFRQKKPDTSGATDLDDYEFPEDDEEDEAK